MFEKCFEEHGIELRYDIEVMFEKCFEEHWIELSWVFMIYWKDVERTWCCLNMIICMCDNMYTKHK